MSDFQLSLFDIETDNELRNTVLNPPFATDDDLRNRKDRIRQDELLKKCEEATEFVRGMPLFGTPFADDISRRLKETPAWTARSEESLTDNMYNTGQYLTRGLPHLMRLPDANPGSLQLLRALVARGVKLEEASSTIASIEEICKGETMIGAELYPITGGPLEKIETAAGAAAVNLLRGEYEIYNPRWRRNKDAGLSFYDYMKWNYRPMPTYHPLFAMLMRELGAYIPQRRPVPYMLCIGKDMGRDSIIVLSAWLLSHPETAMLADAMSRGNGDVDFPGIYVGQRISKQRKKRVVMENPVRWHREETVDVIPYVDQKWGQTNFYAGLMHQEMPQVQDFIRMAGALAKAHKTSYFKDFELALYDALRDSGLGGCIIPKIRAKSLYANKGGRSFPELAKTARNLQIDTADYMASRVQAAVCEIERGLYTKQELEIINNAYSGRL
ncbi:MAG TPA: hypothetical protein VI979_00380 [archaeon]|nr:hypothetical protein [archaeon]